MNEVLVYKKEVVKDRRVFPLVKRASDIIVSLALIIILAVPMLIIAILIRIDSPGPVIFKQTRMGRNGESFTIFKFRSMLVDAPSDMPAKDIAHAAYTTKLGHFLRVTSIDEIPQLLNILRGDMSFVGYRPVCLTEDKLNQLRMQYGVFSMRPGLTGYAQVHGRDEIQSCYEKAKLDAYYLENASVKLDLWCIYRTAITVLSGRGAN